MLRTMTRNHTTRAAATVVAIFSSVTLLVGQTKIVAPKNKYTPKEDVQLGREAAREVQQQLPILSDDGVDDYVERVGQRLAENIPAEFRHPEFRYSFDVVNVSDINAFALPGGPMYVNRGMIQAAKNEGEMAGVLAHEISHVALASRNRAGQRSDQIRGWLGDWSDRRRDLGGTLGQVVSMGSQFGFGTAFLKYGREYERQADLLGAQIMARAGYDPRDMASMFQTIQKKVGQRWTGVDEQPSEPEQPLSRPSLRKPQSSLYRIRLATRQRSPRCKRACSAWRRRQPRNR